jgi:hypothetical protein
MALLSTLMWPVKSFPCFLWGSWVKWNEGRGFTVSWAKGVSVVRQQVSCPQDGCEGRRICEPLPREKCGTTQNE